MGNYRHDLLVAMRVVNSIEKEMMQAEWEDWLRRETGSCERMEEMIARNVDNEKAIGELREGFEDYCQSCREAGKRVFSDTLRSAS